VAEKAAMNALCPIDWASACWFETAIPEKADEFRAWDSALAAGRADSGHHSSADLLAPLARRSSLSDEMRAFA
jgi:hypothetical protein